MYFHEFESYDTEIWDILIFDTTCKNSLVIFTFGMLSMKL